MPYTLKMFWKNDGHTIYTIKSYTKEKKTDDSENASKVNLVYFWNYIFPIFTLIIYDAGSQNITLSYN